MWDDKSTCFFFCQWQHHKCKLTTKPVAPACLVLAGLGAGTVLSFSPCVCCCCRHTRQMWQQADRLLACACCWLMCFVFILLPLSVQHAACALYLHFHCGSHYFPSLKLDFYSAPKHIYILYHRQPAKKVEQKLRMLPAVQIWKRNLQSAKCIFWTGKQCICVCRGMQMGLWCKHLLRELSHFGGWAEGGGGERGKCLIPLPCSRGHEMNSWFAFVDYICWLQEI